MSGCSSRALTLLSSVFGACGLLLVGVAVSTDHWLYLEEGVVLPHNQSTQLRMGLHAGLWRVCFFAGREKGRCFASEYFLEPEINLVTENTENILRLSLVVGLVLYISSINDEVMNRPGGSEQYFQYRYGWSFAFAASSFLLKEVREASRRDCTGIAPGLHGDYAARRPSSASHGEQQAGLSSAAIFSR
uniref:Voltage-dependent calcium channel gamma-7 subunit n=1 Tax=Apteryx owenii TaxID=8824 RepID=A0A8B9PIZ4_APTOW